jgi:hypothetical protein
MVKILAMKRMITRLLLLLALGLFLAGAPTMAVEAGEGGRQQTVVPMSDDDEGGGLGALALLAAGPAFYAYIMGRYSGSGKRHEHERETASTIDGLEKDDVFLRHVTGANSKSIGHYTNSNENKSNFLSISVD